MFLAMQYAHDIVYYSLEGHEGYDGDDHTDNRDGHTHITNDLKCHFMII